MGDDGTVSDDYQAADDTGSTPGLPPDHPHFDSDVDIQEAYDEVEGPEIIDGAGDPLKGDEETDIL